MPPAALRAPGASSPSPLTDLPNLVPAQSLVPEPGTDFWPVPEPLRAQMPGHGLRPGSTVRLDEGATSLLIALLAEVSGAGGWCGAVGLPSLNPAAAAEAGVDLDRLALVPRPGPTWPTVVSALLDAIDLVVVAPPPGTRRTRVDQTTARRLSARARERRGVLLVVGDWVAADVELTVLTRSWSGLGAGHGHLTGRTLTVQVAGRRVGGRPRTAHLRLPAPSAEPAGPSTAREQHDGPHHHDLLRTASS